MKDWLTTLLASMTPKVKAIVALALAAAFEAARLAVTDPHFDPFTTEGLKHVGVVMGAAGLAAVVAWLKRSPLLAPQDPNVLSSKAGR